MEYHRTSVWFCLEADSNIRSSKIHNTTFFARLFDRVAVQPIARTKKTRSDRTKQALSVAVVSNNSMMQRSLIRLYHLLHAVSVANDRGQTEPQLFLHQRLAQPTFSD